MPNKERQNIYQRRDWPQGSLVLPCFLLKRWAKRCRVLRNAQTTQPDPEFFLQVTFNVSVNAHRHPTVHVPRHLIFASTPFSVPSLSSISFTQSLQYPISKPTSNSFSILSLLPSLRLHRFTNPMPNFTLPHKNPYPVSLRGPDRTWRPGNRKVAVKQQNIGRVEAKNMTGNIEGKQEEGRGVEPDMEYWREVRGRKWSVKERNLTGRRGEGGKKRRVES